MYKRVAIVYNEPQPSGYDTTHEEKAVLGVLEAVNAVHQAMKDLGKETVLLPLIPPFETARQKLETLNVDVVFNLFEGFCGDPQSEALVPEALKELGIPFTGCKPDILRLALDKAQLKVVLKAAGVPTPDYQVLEPSNLHEFNLGFPCFVKPRSEDASHGISEDSLVNDFTALERQVLKITETYHCSALVEHFLSGREFNATVMGNSRIIALPISEIVYELAPGIPHILTFAAKWEPDSPYFKGTKVICPAEVTEETRAYVAETAVKAFKLVIGRGYARMDMRMDENGKLNVMEINPNPDISPETGAARQSAAAGMKYAEFINKLINLTLEIDKYDRKNTPDVRGGQSGADADTQKYARI
jgi:D-alanine-D-alanine ligase